jgi:ankyrin repeat protein
MKVFEYLDYEQYDKIIKIINKGKFDINSTDKNGSTLLMNCCSTTCTQGEQQIIDLLLSKNVDVNFQDEKWKYNALMKTCDIKQFEISKKLLPLTNIHAVNIKGETALTLAVFYGRKDLVELFCTTAQSTEDVEKFRSQLTLPDHLLTPYAHEVLDKMAFTFELDDKLIDKPTTLKKPKI